MKFVIKHEIRGRLRVHFVYKNMTFQTGRYFTVLSYGKGKYNFFTDF